MKPINRTSITIFVIIYLLCIIGCQETGRPGDENIKSESEQIIALLKDGKPEYTIDEANDMVSELMPLIEDIAGKTFIKPPEIRLINTDKIDELMIREENCEKTTNNILESKKSENKMMSKFILAIYSKCEHVLYLMPQRIPVVTRLFGFDEKYGRDIAKMNIAHELTHALQDQHINFLTFFEKMNRSEETHAFLSMIEGHATFIEKKIGQLLGIEKKIIDAFPLVNHMEGNPKKAAFGSHELTDKFIKSLPPIQMIYSAGEKFIHYHYNKGGNDKIWYILNNPPVDTLMITEPEIYSAKSYDRLNYSDILNDIYDFHSVVGFHKSDFIYRNDSFSRFDLSQFWEILNIEDKDLIISKIHNLQNLTIYYKDFQIASIDFIVLSDEKYASRLSSATTKLLKQIVKQPNEKKMNLGQCNKGNINVDQKISGIRKYISKENGEEKFFNCNWVIISKGNVLVTYNDVLLDLEDCEILEIANKIFSRYQHAKNL
ncbi:MAG: hypothetical protein A2283_07880 [Lentisphaerae bacterium RIFOXYA12_FULL_48_11]|nr:MAG: hypothetical protein A2283_07880 [Lentisphaerae bacterium RIFOXYA12_FULL_48_11]